MEKCKCYEVRTEELRTTSLPYDPPYKHKYGVCLGTKEVDRCSCGGDEFKCDFYPEKRKAATKLMNTAEMWLKAQEDSKTYIVEQGTIGYSKEKGLFYTTDYVLCDLINFKEWSINDFFNLQWKAMPEKTMTRAEAEKQLGIKIVD